jgi:glycosyltransferase involved in cell wall biosynthesis
VGNRRFQFSVIVPTYNRPGRVQRCLRAMTRLAYDVDRFDVVVVDDGSRTPLDGVVEPFCDKLNITLIRQRNRGPGAARNEGAAVARGKFLAFTDDDCRPASDWLQKLETRFGDTPDGMIGGRVINPLKHNPYSTASQLIVDMAYTFYNQNPYSPFFFTSNNMAVPAELFHKSGGFNPAFRTASEDRELCDRWVYLGHKMTYAPEVLVFHEQALTLRTFCRQHLNYGRGAFQYHQLRKRRGSGKIQNDMKFYPQFPRLLRDSMANIPQARTVKVFMLLLLWQIFNASGFWYETYNNRNSAITALQKTNDTEDETVG